MYLETFLVLYRINVYICYWDGECCLAADTEVNGEVIEEKDTTEDDKTSGIVNGKV